MAGTWALGCALPFLHCPRQWCQAKLMQGAFQIQGADNCEKDSFLTLPPLQPLCIWKKNSAFPPSASSKSWQVATSPQQGDGSQQPVQKRMGIMVFTGGTGKRQMHGNSLESGSTGEALLRRPCWERSRGARAAGCLSLVLPIPPGSRLVGRKATCSVFSSWKVSRILNKEGTEALGQLQDGPGSLLEAGASK